MTFQCTFNLASHTSHKAKYTTKSQQTRYNNGWEIKKPNAESGHECLGEMRTQTSGSAF